MSKASKWIVLNMDIHFDKKYENAWKDLKNGIIFKDINKATKDNNSQIFYDAIIKSYDASYYILFLKAMLEAQKEYGRYNKKQEEALNLDVTEMIKTIAEFISLFDQLAGGSLMLERLSNKALELQNKIAEVELLSEET